MIVAEGQIFDVDPGRRQKLQWGRNLIVAEGRLAAPVARLTPGMLQWGRNLIVAEGRRLCAPG